jgi:hypothetical protein
MARHCEHGLEICEACASPGYRARQAIEDHPDASINEQAKLANVSPRTISNARKLNQDALHGCRDEKLQAAPTAQPEGVTCEAIQLADFPEHLKPILAQLDTVKSKRDRAIVVLYIQRNW